MSMQTSFTGALTPNIDAKLHEFSVTVSPLVGQMLAESKIKINF